MPPQSSSETRHLPDSKGRLTTSAFGLLAAVLLLVIWAISLAILTVLAAIVVAALFDAAARAIRIVFGTSRKLSLLLVFVLAAIVIGGAVYLAGAVVLSQASDFASAAKSLFSEASRFLDRHLPAGLGANASEWLPSPQIMAGGAAEVATTSFGITVSAIAIIVLAAFFTWEPELYRDGFLALLPPARRTRVGDVLNGTAKALRGWIIGQSVSAVVVFVCALAALSLARMPYPILLASQAGLLTFIPTIGPFFAGLAIIIAGLSQNLAMAAWGIAIYLLIQFAESNFVTPFVQKRLVRLPPGLTLAVQLLAGALFGLMGAALAVPLTAAARVIIMELYVKDWLEQSSHADSKQA